MSTWTEKLLFVGAVSRKKNSDTKLDHPTYFFPAEGPNVLEFAWLTQIQVKKKHHFIPAPPAHSIPTHHQVIHSNPEDLLDP